MLTLNVMGDVLKIRALEADFAGRLRVTDRWKPNDINVVVDNDGDADDIIDWCDDHEVEAVIV